MNIGIKKATQIVKSAIETRHTINEYLLSTGQPRNLVSNFVYRLDGLLKTGKVTREDYDTFHKFYSAHRELMSIWEKEDAIKADL